MLLYGGMLYKASSRSLFIEFLWVDGCSHLNVFGDDISDTVICDTLIVCLRYEMADHAVAEGSNGKNYWREWVLYRDFLHANALPCGGQRYANNPLLGLNAIFKRLDQNHSGKVDRSEFLQLCGILDFNGSTDLMNALFNRYDLDRPGAWIIHGSCMDHGAVHLSCLCELWIWINVRREFFNYQLQCSLWKGDSSPMPAGQSTYPLTSLAACSSNWMETHMDTCWQPDANTISAISKLQRNRESCSEPRCFYIFFPGPTVPLPGFSNDRKGPQYHRQDERSLGFESWWIWDAESHGQSVSHHGSWDSAHCREKMDEHVVFNYVQLLWPPFIDNLPPDSEAFYWDFDDFLFVSTFDYVPSLISSLWQSQDHSGELTKEEFMTALDVSLGPSMAKVQWLYNLQSYGYAHIHVCLLVNQCSLIAMYDIYLFTSIYYLFTLISTHV